MTILTFVMLVISLNPSINGMSQCWHLMRDHLSHTDSPLGAGLVGGKISWDAVKLREMQQRLLREVSSTHNEKLILKELLPVLDDDTMTHDSVACHKTPRAIPFPSRRQPGHWVGMPSPQQLRHTSSPNIIYKTKQQLHERSVQGHTFQKDYSRQLNESGIKSRNEFAPRQDGAEQISTATDTKVQPLHFSQKVNKSISKTDKYYQRRHDQRTNSAKEVEINLESGIPVCPSSCRPPLHPDWNYC
ncbi:hypothetical protein OTU49_013501 [Cherax quadricarinatus]|uniref:Uncharacterized protein n=1 Tax=Cherax quadricarinatus TaxID=27406 RepID=A0AAW0VTA6_CHEQU